MLDPNIRNFHLSLEEYKRYSRHLVLEEIGAIGQSRLKASKVLIVGLGGLGSLASMYLVAAGVGHIGIVDYDVVSLSNLQRQILYDTDVIDKKKVLAGQLRLSKINPNCTIKVYDTKLTTQNVYSLVADYDLILDACDNFFTRYILNDIAILFNIPIVYGAILRSEGQVSVFNYRGGANYRDLFDEKPTENINLVCSEGGIFGGVAAVISSLQVNEVVKVILGLRSVLSGKVLVYNFSNSLFKTVVLRKKLLSSRQLTLKLFENLNDEEVHISLGKKRVKLTEVTSPDLTFYLNDHKCMLIDVRSKMEYEAMHLSNAKNFPLELFNQESSIEFMKLRISNGFYFLIYCSFDSRSITAVNILRNFSIKALRLKGGLKALGF